MDVSSGLTSRMMQLDIPCGDGDADSGDTVVLRQRRYHFMVLYHVRCHHVALGMKQDLG